jgi:hypothetical protein
MMPKLAAHVAALQGGDMPDAGGPATTFGRGTTNAAKHPQRPHPHRAGYGLGSDPRERSVFGFPAPGDPYWDEQTLADTQTRYPRADLTPYR